ncbi:hypothetical protein VOLCADRAFT_120322 [Volvox carteri f. nagariensis]|uniref:EF-hand domain-containing protein n=1 Tax=Volvox carteri f. nagariensis TaxID=3068 RepID=D8TJN1_VOLCA|nr:uncharacterized protein VOLCADRAFT_120322 [Volvox carteri f. nagariensis]EFJ52571.1 hypothetical protein VOLCADRAFT_120322 [Volvox carteri f. nagariensis]|eukprot:XP_002946644.1 hypothetical protein VOLCADRAFT_120322 [Volvox carteri f. nagariensis]
MGNGCSTEKSTETLSPHATRSKSMLSKSASGAGSRKTREDLASQFVAEFPADDDPDDDMPSYPEGSREATLLKVFNLLDSENCGYILVPVWKDYVLQMGLTTEALAKELAVIVADQKTPGDPRVTARQFVTAMVHMVVGYDDPEFGKFVAQTLMTYSLFCSQTLLLILLPLPSVVDPAAVAVASGCSCYCVWMWRLRAKGASRYLNTEQVGPPGGQAASQA